MSAGRKLPQVSPGVAQVAPSIQKISKSSTNPSSGAGKSLEEAGNDSNRLGTPRDNIENQDIISPIREGMESQYCFLFCLFFVCLFWGVMAERIRAPNSSSGDSVQRSLGSNPGCDTCVPEQDTSL